MFDCRCFCQILQNTEFCKCNLVKLRVHCFLNTLYCFLYKILYIFIEPHGEKLREVESNTTVVHYRAEDPIHYRSNLCHYAGCSQLNCIEGLNSKIKLKKYFCQRCPILFRVDRKSFRNFTSFVILFTLGL